MCYILYIPSKGGPNVNWCPGIQVRMRHTVLRGYLHSSEIEKSGPPYHSHTHTWKFTTVVKIVTRAETLGPAECAKIIKMLLGSCQLATYVTIFTTPRRVTTPRKDRLRGRPAGYIPSAAFVGGQLEIFPRPPSWAASQRNSGRLRGRPASPK